MHNFYQINMLVIIEADPRLKIKIFIINKYFQFFMILYFLVPKFAQFFIVAGFQLFIQNIFIIMKSLLFSKNFR